MSELRDLYSRYHDAAEPLVIGEDLLGSVGSKVQPFARNEAIALRNARVSKHDPAAVELVEARKEQVTLIRQAKRQKEVAKERMRIKRERYVPTKREVRLGTLPFRITPLVGTIKSSDGARLSQATDQFTASDAELVIVEGDDLRLGMHIAIHTFYQGSTIQHVVVFSGFQETPVAVIRGLTRLAYTGDLATFQYQSPQVVFSTCKCRFPASVSHVPLEEGVNFLAEIACPPNLQKIAAGAPSHFDLFGPVGDLDQDRPALRLLAYPVFDLRLGAQTIFKNAFFEIETVQIPLAEGGTGWDMRVGAAGYFDLFGESFKVWSDIAGDTDPLVFHLQFGDRLPVRTDLRDLAPLFSGNGDFLAILPGSAQMESGLAAHISGFALRECTWIYDLFSHQLTSLAVSIEVLHTLTLTHPWGAELALSDFRLTWLVGFPDSGSGRPVSASAEAKLRHEILGETEVTIGMGPARLDICGSVEGMQRETFDSLVKTLALTQEEDVPDDFGVATEVFFRFDFTEGFEVSLLNAEGDSVMWARRS